jgi:hypothetical protein
MAYNADLVRVKQAANIATTNSDFDTELTEARDKAYNFMNNILVVTAPAIPLTGLSTGDTNLICQIEADMAAGFFKEQTTQPVEGERTKKHILRERAEQMLQSFIGSHYGATGSRRSSFFRNTRTARRLEIDASEPDTFNEVD